MVYKPESFIIHPDEPVLVTGATGFIGPRVVEALLRFGLRNVRCFARPFSDVSGLQAAADQYGPGARVEIVRGNLQSPDDCREATRGVTVVFHLAAGAGEKSFPDAMLNSVVTTRNLLDAIVQQGGLRRFVNVSSFTVYTNQNKPHGSVLDEECPVEKHPELRDDPYCFAKVKQEEVVAEYAQRFGIPCVTLRPGYVYGPGKNAISGRIGIDTFGMFLHLGGSNTIPFTYVDNCAEAIALAGLVGNVDGEVFNVVDDGLYSSRQFLRLYKRNVRSFTSFYVPHSLSYLFCLLWEKYAAWSQGQLPAVFNRRRWHSVWKRTRYSNSRLKNKLGWSPRISMEEGLRNYFDACRAGVGRA